MASLDIKNLAVRIETHNGTVRAEDGVSFDVEEGEALGLVGESGCGKSTAAHAIVGLHPATAGSIRYDDHELNGMRPAQWRPLRRKIQMIFQDPYASLDPRQTVAPILSEPLKIHNIGKPRVHKMHAMTLLEAVWPLAPATSTATPTSSPERGANASASPARLL